MRVPFESQRTLIRHVTTNRPRLTTIVFFDETGSIGGFDTSAAEQFAQALEADEAASASDSSAMSAMASATFDAEAGLLWLEECAEATRYELSVFEGRSLALALRAVARLPAQDPRAMPAAGVQA